MRKDFVAKCHVDLRRMFQDDLIIFGLNVEMFVYSTRVEIPYVMNFLALSAATSDGWVNVNPTVDCGRGKFEKVHYVGDLRKT